MPAFTLSIFLSAFLLFVVQPLLSKKMLPWFGSSPTVWLSNILFFQVALFIGYLYAYLLTKARSSLQIKIHLTLLIFSLLFLPLHPLEHWTQLHVWEPLRVLITLSFTMILPGIILSSSSPLLQYWYCQTTQNEYPYKYYAVSNFGSLLGLFVFPFFLEPVLKQTTQLSLWSLSYGIFVVTSFGCLYLVHRHRLKNIEAKPTLISVSSNNSNKTTLPSLSVVLSWILLTTLSSILLLSTTQILLQDVASFPLLWIIPLALFLISYIVTFYRPSWYLRPFWMILYVIFCVLCLYFPSQHLLSLFSQIMIYASLLFSGCMICHGELIRQKPHPQYLTMYYLSIAGGGMLGGIFVNFIAPLIFNDWWDFYLVIIGIYFYAGFHILYQSNPPQQKKQYAFETIWFCGFIGLTILLGFHLHNSHKNTIYSQRNFFGVFDIDEKNPHSNNYHYRTLSHGSILYGQQFLNPERRKLATSYYSQGSGVGLAIHYERLLKQSNLFKGLRIGVVGLGAGTIAALATKSDSLQFYEIDPDIIKVANQYFFFLKDSPAHIEITVGDGRLELTESLKKRGSENYDILAIDAFNGDAIPLHLLTLEAMKIYLAHLSPNGILAFHISSRYVDLYPPLKALATHLGLFAFHVQNDANVNDWISSATWVLISRQLELGLFLHQQNALEFSLKRMDSIWVDDFNFLLPVIRW